MFQLNSLEYREILRSKNLTIELKQGKYSKYLPYAFTGQEIYMLMTVLTGELVINIIEEPIVKEALLNKIISICN